MIKSERDELRRLLRSRFKVLRADVAAREAELQEELVEQVEARFLELDRRYDQAIYEISLAVDEANRKANDIGRELYGREKWGEKTDRQVVIAKHIDRPGVEERRVMRYQGTVSIQQRVRKALLELDRQENQLLTDLATSALESAESRDFFNRIPSATELVPAYRLQEITGEHR